jgi:hypothetical protein
MVPLKLFGALGRAARFPDRIDAADLARMVVGRADRWETLLTRIRASRLEDAEWREIAEGIERALARWEWSRSRLGRLDAALWRTLGRAGLTPRRAKELDAGLLGGAGARAFRWFSARRRPKTGHAG